VTLSGSVKLTAPLAGRRAAYRWQYSTDGGKTVVKGGASDWSAPLSMVVS